MDNGRPPRVVQLKIERKLRKCFQQGMSASLAAVKTGMNPKTVCKYYNKMAKQISDLEENAFLTRGSMEVERIRLGYENLIAEAYEALEQIKEEVDKYKKKGLLVPLHLLSAQKENMKIISTQIEKKSLIKVELLEKNESEQKEKRVSEHVVRKTVRDIVLHNSRSSLSACTPKDIEFEIIKLTKCTPEVAHEIYLEMERLGLYICSQDMLQVENLKHDLTKFALMRGYV